MSSFGTRLQDYAQSVYDFEKEGRRYIADQFRKDPERIFFSPVTTDPFSTKVVNASFGTDYKSLVDQMGGMRYDIDERMTAQGKDPTAGRQMQDVAHVIASMYAANYGETKIKAIGEKRGWDPRVVQLGIDAAKRGVSAALQGQPQPKQTIPVARPPQTRQGTFGVQRSQAQAAQPVASARLPDTGDTGSTFRPVLLARYAA